MFNRFRNKEMKETQLSIIALTPQAFGSSTPHASRLMPSSGFTLVEMIGVLAILAILASFITPNVINQLRNARRDAEDTQLANIARGIELFIRQHHTFPANLAALSPDYVPVPPGQLTNNANGFLRYYDTKPSIDGYTNTIGLAPANLSDSRFILISDLTQNANPTLTTEAGFQDEWERDETGTPDLKIHRGHVSHLFHLLSLSANGIGGSYAIDGNAINSNGGTLTLHARYHVTGTTVALDETDPFALGGADTQFTMTTEAGYQFDPDCPTGSQWRVINSGCYAP